MAQPRIRVAIIGGGLAGATLANALINLPHLDLNLYESAPEFSERGAAVTLGPYAQKALQQILPSVKETLKRAGGVPKPHSRTVLVRSSPRLGPSLVSSSTLYSLKRGSLLLLIIRSCIILRIFPTFALALRSHAWR